VSPKATIPYYRTDHGPDIFPRRRVFTPEETRWRKATVSFLWKRLQSVPTSSPSTGILREPPAAYRVYSFPTSKEGKNRAQRELREQLTEILLTLRVVNEILEVQYGSPDWGNQPHVIDELVFILLARRSKIEDAARHLDAIRDRYTIWENVAFASPDELKAVIMGGGLEDDKVKFIQASLQAIHQKFGRIDEVDFVDMFDEELDAFLLELPGIGPRSSACILMYARNADIFRADTHCIRILDRLGLFAPFGFEWSQVNHKQAEQDLLLLIPPHMRSDLHRNLLALGREVCKPQKPLCEQCELKGFCAYYRHQRQAKHLAVNAPIAIDMFCGAGGFSLGLRQVGFKIVTAIDNDPNMPGYLRLLSRRSETSPVLSPFGHIRRSGYELVLGC
jgi:endonuclease-3